MKKITIILALSLGIFFSIARAENTKPSPGNFTIGPAIPNSITPWKIILENKPGEIAQSSVKLKNNTNETIELTLEIADELNKDDQKTYTTNSKDNKFIGVWGTIESSVTLKAQEGKQIEFEISIPENTELAEYKGAITATKIGTNGGNLRRDLRIVAPIQLTVTNNPKPIPLLNITQETQVNIFAPTPFFWGTIIIFLSCMLYLIHAKQKENKSKK